MDFAASLPALSTCRYGLYHGPLSYHFIRAV